MSLTLRSMRLSPEVDAVMSDPRLMHIPDDAPSAIGNWAASSATFLPAMTGLTFDEAVKRVVDIAPSSFLENAICISVRCEGRQIILDYHRIHKIWLQKKVGLKKTWICQDENKSTTRKG